MNKLALIIKTEYKTSIQDKSFWIGTLLIPLLMILFGAFIGYLSLESDTLHSVSSAGGPDNDDLTGRQVAGMMTGMLLTLFIMMYGAQIYNKVKTEKCNRIVEILATCVPGSTMMTAKVISVGLVGLTQLALWFVLISAGVLGLVIVLAPDISWSWLANPDLWKALSAGIVYFTGGYILYGALFAATGAMTDVNNENQQYMTILTFLLLGSFYLGMFAVDNPTGTLATVCAYIPFTSPTIGAVRTISADVPVWSNLLSVAILYICAFGSISIAGKIYTSSLLLRGTKFSPRDIMVFLRSR